MTLQSKANRTNESNKKKKRICVTAVFASRSGLMFKYLVQGNCPKISSISDKNGWKAVMKALSIIGFTEEDVQVIISHFRVKIFRNLYNSTLFISPRSHFTSATLQAVVIFQCSCSPSLPLFSPRTCSISWAASSILETLSLEKERREKLISPPSLRSTILRRSEQSCLYFWMFKYAPNPGRRCSQEQMCCCFPAAGC